MSAVQVTEEHIYTTAKVGEAYVAGEDAKAAQLIADSEAKATAELKKLADHWCDMHTVCAKERDQLRAEVERLRSETARIGRNGADEYIRAERAEEIADRYGKRAISLEAELAACKESLHLAEGTANLALVHRDAAEAELAGIRALANRRNKRDHSQDTTHQLVAALDQALDIAQAELATERARIADLVADLNDACITLTSAEEDCDDYAMRNTRFKLTAVREVLLQHIPNAAMKEETK